MKKSTFYESRDTKWLGGRSPASARIVGAIIAIVVILPFVLSTYIERQFGDMPTLGVMAAIVLLASGTGYILSRRRYALIPVLLVALSIGSVVSLYVTTVMSW